MNHSDYLNGIEKIELTRKNHEDIEELLQRYSCLVNNYKSVSHDLKTIIKQNNEHDNFISSLFKKTENNKGKIDTLSQQKNKLYEEIKKEFKEIRRVIKKMISENNDYDYLYIYYLDCYSFSEEVYTKHRINIKLVENKNKIDRFFRKIKKIIEENKTISDKELKAYSNNYKNIVNFLKKVYSAKSNSKKFVQTNLEFSNELNMEDAYTILSMISMFYTNVINPIYNEYKDTYIIYKQKMEFIKKYENKVYKIAKLLIKYNEKEDIE
jgi:hypothetical protein